jgi:hypothetical protein
MRGLRHPVSLLLALAALPVHGAPASLNAPLSDAEVLRQLEQRRDTFIRRAAEEGYAACPAPRIVLEDTPSYGNYVAERNEIVVSSWSGLSDEERRGFADMARAIGGHASAVSVFEGGTYRWVFVHELGHWWAACRHQTRPNSFGEENGANRIALAFWREQQPRFAAGIVAGFEALLQSMPSAVPAGAPLGEYVDAHFAQLSHGASYTWVQASSVAGLAHESPAPSFHKALSQPLFPF